MVPSRGIEPRLRDPQSRVLSVERQGQIPIILSEPYPLRQELY